MSEKKETVPELAGLSTRGDLDTDDEYFVPDYVMRDFGETEEMLSSSARTSGRRLSAGFFF